MKTKELTIFKRRSNSYIRNVISNENFNTNYLIKKGSKIFSRIFFSIV